MRVQYAIVCCVVVSANAMCDHSSATRSALFEQLTEVVNFIDTALLTVQLVRAEVFNSENTCDNVRIRSLLEGIVREKMSELDERAAYLSGFCINGALGLLHCGGLLTHDLIAAIAALRQWTKELRMLLQTAHEQGVLTVQTTALCLREWELIAPLVVAAAVTTDEITPAARMKCRQMALDRALALGCTERSSGCCAIL